MPASFSSVLRLIRLSAPLLLLLVSCGGTVAEEQGSVLSLTIYKPEVENTAGSQALSVTASGQWTLDTAYDGAQTGWIHLEKTSGIGSEAGITLSWDKNRTEEVRSCIVTVSCGGKTDSVQLTQQGGSSKPNMDSDPVPAWLELPATDSEDLLFFTHSMKLSDGTVTRNYSYYWDIGALVAHWVAYPLNKSLRQGNSGRTDQWGLDPNLPRHQQPVLFSGYGGFGDRGHQIPSADRQIYSANVQTFYGTNMTPQSNALNTGRWSDLEGRVRTWSDAFDTLYVVTGCVLEGSPGKAYDNDGKAVTIPSGYFKALLGYKKSGTLGRTFSQGGYTSVAFYFPNEKYGKPLMDAAMTVSDLEKKTGIDFYVNLPSVVGADVARTVESTKDTYWWK